MSSALAGGKLRERLAQTSSALALRFAGSRKLLRQHEIAEIGMA
jgi:hypothetical protein